jgi:hypothetical protein
VAGRPKDPRPRTAHDGSPSSNESDSATGRAMTAPKNTERSRPMMATCSPRARIRLAGAYQARLRRRNIV